MLFAGDTSIVITNPTATEFITYINQINFEINRWPQSTVFSGRYRARYVYTRSSKFVKNEHAR
jgi:hypothetical protein